MAVELNATTILRVLGDLFFRNLGLKLVALGLAAILFVLTRDEVTRRFEVPLRVKADAERVLLTDLPHTIQVQVRGPWTRLNRLTDYDLGEATIDLKEAEPGPLEIDGGAIVMPSGVVLAGITYDQVDLRFDPVIRRPINVVPTVVGQPATDYKLVRYEVNPAAWPVRGGATEVQQVTQLTTEPFDLSGARNTTSRSLLLVAPGLNVELVGADGDAAHVEVRAVVEPLPETREVEVRVVAAEELDPEGVIPKAYTIELAGPLPSFRELDKLEAEHPVEAEVVPLDLETPDGGKVVEIRFKWAEVVPPDVRSALTIGEASQRVNVPPPPPPPEPPGAGAPL